MLYFLSFLLYCPFFFDLRRLKTVFDIFKACLEHKRQLTVSPIDQQLARSGNLGHVAMQISVMLSISAHRLRGN